jgi:5-formyltetrahydrofolate cyclo-ligase
VSEPDVVSAKRALRAALRSVRREIADQPLRSARICRHLREVDAVRSASTVMLFRAVPGEPDLAALAAWCRSAGKVVVVPDSVPTAAFPIDPSRVDAVLVPGVAFTADGKRLGQGGGWFDRFLAELRVDAIAIGVCFGPQVVDDLPTEAHDVLLDLVVTDTGVAGRGGPER